MIFFTDIEASTIREPKPNVLILGKKRQGFACLSKEKLSEITKRGRETTHRLGLAYKFTSEAAKKAQRKSVIARRRNDAKAISK